MARTGMFAALVVIATLLAAGAFSVTAVAAPADLDPTFGTGGALTFPIVPAEDRIEAIAVQPDGKIVAVGTSYNGSNRDFAIARFNADGSLDTNFSDDGYRVIDFTGGKQDGANAVAVQPDGKIVVAGYTVASPEKEAFAVTRLLPNGDMDPGFGNSSPGHTFVWLAGTDVGNQRANAVAVQPDGRIVVAGHSSAGGTSDFAIARLKTDGTLDGTFDTDGKRLDAIGAGTDEINDIALRPDGKVVVTGESEGTATGTDIAVARYNGDGSLDTTFNFVGVQTTALTLDTDAGQGVVVQPDGRIVVAGSAGDGAGHNNIALVRFAPGGGLDPSFGAGGATVTSLAPYETQALDLAAQNNNKFVVVGDYYRDSPWAQDFLVAQYDSTGALDKSFDGDGVMTHDFLSPTGEYAQAVAIQPDGKIAIGGTAWIGSNYDFAMMRLAGELPIVPSSPPPSPVAKIKSPLKPKIRSSKLKSLRGEAGPVGLVAKVEIALRRVDRKLLKRGRCLWLKNSKGQFKKTKAVKKKCGKPRFLPASGKESWSYRLKKRLAKGSYELYVRVTLSSGEMHSEFSKAAGNLLNFKVL